MLQEPTSDRKSRITEAILDVSDVRIDAAYPEQELILLTSFTVLSEHILLRPGRFDDSLDWQRR